MRSLKFQDFLGSYLSAIGEISLFMPLARRLKLFKPIQLFINFNHILHLHLLCIDMCIYIFTAASLVDPQHCEICAENLFATKIWSLDFQLINQRLF